MRFEQIKIAAVLLFLITSLMYMLLSNLFKLDVLFRSLYYIGIYGSLTVFNYCEYKIGKNCVYRLVFVSVSAYCLGMLLFNIYTINKDEETFIRLCSSKTLTYIFSGTVWLIGIIWGLIVIYELIYKNFFRNNGFH